MRTNLYQVNTTFIKQIALELRIFLIDARFETTAIFINFILPSAVLIFTVLNTPQQLISDSISAKIIFQFTTYICLTTVMNLVISYLVSSRQEGILLTHTHLFGSPRPFIMGLILGQSLVSTAESVLLSILGMSLTNYFNWKLILAVAIGIPLATFILSFFLLPLALSHGTASSSAAVISVILLILFNLPKEGTHPFLTFVLQLNPVYFTQNIQSFLLSTASMKIIPLSMGNCFVIILSILSSIISIKHLPLRPLLKRA